MIRVWTQDDRFREVTRTNRRAVNITVHRNLYRISLP